MRGFGSVITVRPAMTRGLGRRSFRGLGMAAWIGMLMPVLLGIGAPLATILGLRYWINPAAGRTQAMLVRYAPAIGFGVGATSAVVLGMLGGYGAGAATATAAGLTAGGASAYDMLRRTAGSRIDTALAPSAGATQGLRGRLGTTVPEFRGLPSRTGAIVMEQQTRGLGKPGQEITLGSVNPQVFGTPGF
jgi:hypothetical protein